MAAILNVDFSARAAATISQQPAHIHYHQTTYARLTRIADALKAARRVSCGLRTRRA